MTEDAPTFPPPADWLALQGIVIPGHQVASRPSAHYPAGTIALQKPFFAALGLDLSGYYLGTINVSLAPETWRWLQPRYTFPLVEWTDAHPPETFSFARCWVATEHEHALGWIYFPHPETKQRHFQAPSLIEIIAPWLATIRYHTPIKLWAEPGAVVLDTPTAP